MTARPSRRGRASRHLSAIPFGETIRESASRSQRRGSGPTGERRRSASPAAPEVARLAQKKDVYIGHEWIGRDRKTWHQPEVGMGTPGGIDWKPTTCGYWRVSRFTAANLAPGDTCETGVAGAQGVRGNVFTQSVFARRPRRLRRSNSTTWAARDCCSLSSAWASQVCQGPPRAISRGAEP